MPRLRYRTLAVPGRFRSQVGQETVRGRRVGAWESPGDLQIAPGAVVTVTVTARKTHYLAILGDLVHPS